MLAGFESRKVNVGRKKKLLYCEADFKSAISAFDDTVTQAFGVPKRHLSQDRLHTTNKFAHENDFGDVTFIPRRKTAYVPTGNLSGFAISPPESHAIQMSNDGLLSGRLQEPQPILNSSNLRAPFPSTTQSHQDTTENRNAEYCERSVVKPLAFNPSFASAPALIQNGWQSRSIQSAIELLEVDSDSVDIALGVPNSRKPPAVPAAPRICRARNFFSQLKSGLSEWIELQTTLLQQAELGQDVATEKLVSEFLSRLQRRLSTITRLEEEYIRFYRVYRQRRSKHTERRSSKSIQPTPITQLSRGLSKSVSALTSSDSYEPFDVTPKQQDSQTLQTSVHCVWGTCLLSAVPPRLTHKQEHPDNEKETLSIPDRNSVTNTSAYSSLGTEVRPKRQKSHLLSRAPRFMKSELLLEPNVKYEQFLKHLLCLIEAQTEYLSGTFKCEVIGISGAGRCFNKDEFKVNFVYGPPTLPTLYEIHDKEVKLLPVRKSSIETENVVHLEDKWIAHGRIHCTQSVRKNHDRIPLSACENVPVDYSFPKQIWDNPCNIFSPLIDSVLTLKAVEVKRFGKVEILQHQSYDIISLFRSKYFQLSTPLKHNGQLKFHFLIGWSPLADTNDQNLIYYSPHSRYGSASSGTSKTKLLSSACLNLNDPSPVSLKGDGSQTTDWEPSPVSDRTSVTSSNVESSMNMSRTRSCILYPTEKKKSSASNNVTNVSANSGSCVKEDSGKTTQWSRWISTPNLGKAVANARLRLNTGCLREISIRPRKKTQNGVTIEPSVPQLSTDSLCSFIAETQPAKSDSPSSVSSQREFEDELQFVIDKLQNLLRLNDAMKTVLQPLRCVLLKLQSSIQQHTFGKRNSAVAKLSSLRENGLCSQFVTNSMIKSKAENGKPGKSDTLTDLWESFAFLDCSKPMGEGACNEDSTDAVFGPQLQSVSLPNVSATQAPLDGSYNQLGSTVLWHLNYVTRIFDRLSQLHEVTCNQADEKIECLSPLFFPGSISLCFVEMSLSIQTDAFRDLAELIETALTTSEAAIWDYVSQLLASQSEEWSQFNHPLICSRCPDGKTKPISKSQLLVDFKVLRSWLLRCYEDHVGPKWPDVNGNKVVDTFVEDLLDVPLDGVTPSSVSLVHLKQRLKPTDCTEAFSTRGSNCCSKLEARICHLLSYLADQTQIQNELSCDVTTALRTLSTLPYYRRWSSEMIPHKLERMTTMNDTQHRSGSGVAADLFNNLPQGPIALHSTRTWLHVASMSALTNDPQVTQKTLDLVMNFDRQLNGINWGRTSEDLLHPHQKQILSSNGLPFLFTAGPPYPIFVAYQRRSCLSTTRNINFSPLWISMVWGLTQQLTEEYRLFGLHGVALLTRTERIRSLSIAPSYQLDVSHRSETREPTMAHIGLRLLDHLRFHDADPKVQSCAKQILHQLQQRVVA